ncbi:MAG: hypothetical protein ACE5FQ_12890 [Thiogranum sp.]
MAEESDEEPLSEEFLAFLADSEDERGGTWDLLDYASQQWQILDPKTETTDE